MSPQGMKDLTLKTVARGSAEEGFNFALKELVENALDPNTEPEAKRTIIMKFEFTPNDTRELAVTQLTTTTKLAPRKPVQDVMYFGKNRRTNELVATCRDPSQLEIGEDPDKSDVVPISNSDRRAK